MKKANSSDRCVGSAINGKGIKMNLFNRALKKEVLEVPPIWFMRQAGRYHSHYQGLRAKNSFLELCRKPELACEVALGPVQDFDFDAAILFSDILFPLDVLGFGLDFTDKGPSLEKRLDAQFLKQLLPFEEAWPRLEFQKTALQLTRRALPDSKGLIGFVGGLWTLFTYAVDSDHKPPLINSKKEMGLFAPFCERLVPLLTKNIELQFEGGADLVCIFDTSAGELTPFDFQSVVVPQLKKIFDKFPGQILYYSKGTMPDHFEAPAWKALPLLGQGFDHRYDLARVLKSPRSGVVQGNFDQTLLHCDAQDLNQHLDHYLKPLKGLKPEERRGWISGLGHGILPKTPEDNVRRFIDRVRKEFG